MTDDCTDDKALAESMAPERELQETQARVARLEGALTVSQAQEDELTRDNRLLTANVARLEEALRFYAKPARWSVDGTFTASSPDSDYLPDCGNTARAALSGAGEPSNDEIVRAKKAMMDRVFNRDAGAADMRERAAMDIDNEHEIAKEEASNDGDYGAGFLHGLKYAAERIRALPLEGKADD